MSLHRVKFAKGWDKYNGGETAAFQPTIAAKLVKLGLASPVDIIEEEPAVAAKPDVDEEADAAADADAEVAPKSRSRKGRRQR